MTHNAKRRGGRWLGAAIWRLLVVSGFAAALALVFGSFAPIVMSQLYEFAYSRWHASGAPQPLDLRNVWNILPLALLGGMIGIYLGNQFHRMLVRSLGRWDNLDKGDKITLFVGIFTGLIVSMPILQLFSALQIQTLYFPLVIVGVILGFSSLAVYTLKSMDEILPWSQSRGKSRRTGIKILDTNVIIDGRIYDVAKSGFLDGQLYVPGFVLDELQHIADHHDSLRRQRGRRGLEVLKHMQAEFPMEVRIHDRHAPDTAEPVDSRLVRLAKAIGGDIVTNDFNLNRVATVQDVKVLSLNDLALALRSNVMPQETMEIAVIKEGNQVGQGVGYLDDGTMVVIENGQGFIGETVGATVTQVIQTERGKMIFAKVEGVETPSGVKRPVGPR